MRREKDEMLKKYSIGLFHRDSFGNWKREQVDNYLLRHTVWEKVENAEAKCRMMNAADGFIPSEHIDPNFRYMVVPIR